MFRFWRWALVALLGVAAAAFAFTHATSAPKREPLTNARLLALVAGNALPEDILSSLKNSGLTFTPTPEYLQQLKNAGASADLLKAINKAAVHPSFPAEDKLGAEWWPHIAEAGKQIRAKSYTQAENEVNAALQAGAQKLDAGFVMGEALRQQEKWPMALKVYQEIVENDPDFAEAQIKLSFVLHREGDQDEALDAAQAALRLNPNSAEAHKNAGLALQDMRRYDSAEKEYRQALNIKPDYSIVHYDLGLLLYYKGDFPRSIEEYKIALALDPNSIDARVNLGLSYAQINDAGNAIRLLREAKQMDPKSFPARSNLAWTFMHFDMTADGVAELRELEAIAPESVVCHVCLGNGLDRMRDFDGAEKEFQISIKLDPTNGEAYQNLARAYEDQGKYDLALEGYDQAERVSPESVDARVGKGRVLLEKKQPKLALKELEEAKDLAPGNAVVLEQYGRTLEAVGDLAQAQAEYKEALELDPQNVWALLDLAEILEKQGDWARAIENYRAASKIVQESVLTMRGESKTVVDAPGAYQAAQLRLNQHLADLRATGKSAEADKLVASIDAAQAAQGTSGSLDADMEAGTAAFKEHRFDDAERNYVEAVKLAGEIKPRDARLVLALGALGSLQYMRKDIASAHSTFAHQLNIATEMYGADSPQLTHTLDSLARICAEQGDTAKAEKFAKDELSINEKSYGTNSIGYSIALMTMAHVFETEKQYAKAIPYAEQAVKLHESLAGPKSIPLLSSKKLLCSLYDSLDQPATIESCDRELLPIMEALYGTNNAALAPVLASQAKALRGLGRTNEATKVEDRLKSLQQSVAAVN
jgi:tetratricopeptide (TPR) repeat protein